MIYKFKSKATADLVMLETSGQQILSIIGKGGGSDAKGIVTVSEQSAAISAIEAAISVEENQRKEAEAEAAKEGRKLPPPGITLRTRAWPFVEMLRKAQKENAEVTWGV
jgi:Domain of unknown function (DUF1840)